MSLIDSLRRVAVRAKDTATQQGMEIQVVLMPSGLRVAALVRGSLISGKDGIPWERVVEGEAFEREAQEMVDSVVATAKVADATDISHDQV